MPNRKGKTGNKGGHQVWKESSKYRDSSSVADSVGSANSAADQGKNNKLTGLSIGELKKRVQNVASTVQFGSVPSKEPSPVQGEKTVWKPKHYGTVSGINALNGAASAEKNSAGSSKVVSGSLAEDFVTDTLILMLRSRRLFILNLRMRNQIKRTLFIARSLTGVFSTSAFLS